MADDITLEEISAVSINNNFSALKTAAGGKAKKGGDPNQTFYVADAIEPMHAVNKRQLDVAVTQLETEISTKADKTYVDNQLATKANTADVNAALDTKASITDMNTALATKANVTDMNAALALKADLNGSGSQKFNVADATESTQAVSKGQLDTIAGSINQEITKIEDDLKKVGTTVPFSMNSGNVDSNGNADLLGYSGTTLSFKVGSSYPTLVMTYADKSQETLSALSDITGLSSNGNYIVLKEKNSSAANVILSTKITQGKIFPASPVDGDYHCLTSTDLKTYKRISGAWVETQYVLIGTVIVSGGTITTVSTNPYNQNGYNVNAQTQSYRFPNFANCISKTVGTTYQAECDGWLNLTAVIGSDSYYGLTFSLYSDFSSSLVPYYEATTSPINYQVTSFVPITKGTYYKTYQLGTVLSAFLKFYPAKGGN